MLTEKDGPVYPEAEFVRVTYKALNALGFDSENTIACAGLCRDEITQPLAAAIKEVWGESFNTSSLAGMFFSGKTGLSAAMHHAPNCGGRERYVFYTLPHIAVDEGGRVGVCRRRGREGESTACGALVAFRNEMVSGRLCLDFDKEDIEQSLLKARLIREVTYGTVPDLLELTIMAQKAALADLEGALAAIVDTRRSDYAVVSGVQVHGPQDNFVWRGSCCAVVGGSRREAALEAPARDKAIFG